MGRRNGTGSPRFWAGTSAAIARRPRLWGTAFTQARRLARPRWWRRAPFVPAPSPEYLRHRLETQYGRDPEPEPDDVVAYLEWCREMTSLSGRAPWRRRELRLSGAGRQSRRRRGRKLRLLRRRSAKPRPSRLRRGTRR